MTPSGPPVRPARAGDVPAMREIERAAGLLFLEVGMPEVAADPPLPATELLRYVERGHAWVSPGGGAAGAGPDEAVGYALVSLMTASLHLAQLSVWPEHGRRGRGRALFGAVRGHARLAGRERVTLSTFRDVPWNAPLYARWGARPLAPDEVDDELAAIVERERAIGLDPAARVLMAVGAAT